MHFDLWQADLLLCCLLCTPTNVECRLNKMYMDVRVSCCHVVGYRVHIYCQALLLGDGGCAQGTSTQWRSQYRGKERAECPWQQKNYQKNWKNQEKINKKRKNWEEKAKTGKILSLCPLWQKGLATLLPQLVILNTMDKRLGVGPVGYGIGLYIIYHGVWDMIFLFYVEHNPVAGSHKGVDFTFHVMRCHWRFTVIEEDGHADGIE